MQKRSSLLVVFLFVILGSSHAQQVNYRLAKRLAAKSLMTTESELQEIKLSRTSIKHLEGLYSDADKPFYVFNNSRECSFVIVSGDSRMKAILGYGDNRDLKNGELPCGLITLLSHYSEQYKLLQEFGEEMTDVYYNVMERDVGDIPPLVSSTWGQDSPYNDDCPIGCPSGCVATAMAQIMRTYKYPNSGNGSFSYTSRTNRYHLSYNYDHANFDWESTQDEYAAISLSDSKGRKAAANILLACGVSVGMDYTREGSGAYDVDIPYALINFFSYNKNTVLYERSYFKNQEWYNMVFDELEAGRPILYCGQDKYDNGGHAFIIDGYRKSDGKFHVNWGWNGTYDGYYELDALDPGKYKFSTGQSMIARFSPDTLGDVEDTFYAEEFKHSGDIALDKSIQFSLVGAVNYSNSSSYVVSQSSFSGILGVGLFDKDFAFMLSLSKQEINGLRTGYAASKILTFPVRIPSKQIEKDEVYYIAPYVMSANSDKPTRIRTFGGLTDYYTITSEGGKPNEDPDDPLPEIETLLSENFENSGIPQNWSQDYVQGAGSWRTQMVMFGDDTSENPNPASGNGYAYLNYNSGTAFANIRTVTRLESPVLYGNEGQEYIINLKIRKYESRLNTNAIISVLIDRECDGNWSALSEQVITNSNTWLSIKVPFTHSGNYRIGFEGSIEYGSNIFIDDINIGRIETSSIKKPKMEETIKSHHSSAGIKCYREHKGLNIVRKTDGSIIKYISR